jgi:hypothetical protein
MRYHLRDPHQRSTRRQMTTRRFQIIKGLVLIAVAVAALAIGIYKGGLSTFFGIVIGLVCGLVGFLFTIADEEPRRLRKVKKR